MELTPTAAKAILVLMAHGRSRAGLHCTAFARHMGWGRQPQGQARMGARYAYWLASKGWARVSRVQHSSNYTHLAVHLTDAGEEAYHQYRKTHPCPL